MGNDFSTRILNTCKAEDEETAIDMLKKYPEHINDIDKNNNTTLMIACKYKLQHLARFILLCVNFTTLSRINNNGDTALMIACNSGLKNIAMSMLNHPKNCLLSQANENGNTALILACNSKLQLVAMEILKYPTQCDLSQANINGDTALMITCCKEMQTVAKEILKHPENCDLLQVDNDGYNAEKYCTSDKMKRIKKLIQFHTENMKDDKIFSRKSFDKKDDSNCLFCGDESDNHVIFNKCNHVVVSCQDCISLLPSKECVICRSKNNRINKVYISTDSL